MRELKKKSLENKITDLIQLIESSFSDVKLENGISWREAEIVDSYGSEEERNIARNKDEKRLQEYWIGNSNTK
ncbi:MAG: hypothetical protein EPN85_13500 [Bacteroidetes bacterium]|nr:MAG: hypothetical protein EPN85_13500 [Bacteroidota bacterium]